MPSSKQIQVGMGRENPEPVVLAAESLDRNALAHVPYPNGFVFGDRQNQFGMWMKEGCRYIVVMSAARIDFPGLCVRHAPQLDLTVVTGRHNKRKSGVKGSPVHTTVVSLQHILDHDIHIGKEVHLGAIRSYNLVFKAHWLRSRGLLFECCKVPYTHCLVHRSRYNQVFVRMELSTHHVVVVAGQYRNTGATLPVPNTDGLVIRCTDNPWVFVMEEHGTHIIQMTM